MSRARDRSRERGRSTLVPWTPARLAPALWFEADTLVAQSGGSVAGIGNLGTLGATCDAAQATGGNQPTYSATGGPGGRPAIIHTAPRYLLVPHNAGWKSTQHTWWAVCKYDAIGAFQTDSNSADDVSWQKGRFIGKPNGTAGNTDLAVATTGYNLNQVVFAAVGTSGWQLIIGRYDGSAVKGRRNGVDGTDDPFAGPLVHGSGPLVIGGSIASVTPTYAYNLEGRWVSRGDVPRSMSSAECVSLAGYVLNKWGVS